MAQHITVPGELVFNLAEVKFTQEGIYNAIKLVKPTDPNLTVVSIAIPLVHINCKEFGTIDPISELKNAAERLYNYFMQYYIEPLWNALYSLFKALENLIGSALDLTLPVFDLKISDLFDTNLFETIKQKVINLYYNAKQQLINILESLGIRWPITFGTNQPEFEIEEIVKSILNSIWQFLIKAFKKIIEYIKIGLVAWEAINTNGIPTWSQIWEQVKSAILGSIINFLTNVPSVSDIYNALVEYAKQVWNKVSVTVEEILAVIKDFTFGIFGKLFNFTFPTWNPKTFNPEIDLQRMLNQMLLYLKNFIFNLIGQFVNGVLSVLEFFGISLGSLGTLTIPITLCAVTNE